MKKVQNGIEGWLVPVTSRARAGDQPVAAVSLGGGCVPGIPQPGLARGHERCRGRVARAAGSGREWSGAARGGLGMRRSEDGREAGAASSAQPRQRGAPWQRDCAAARRPARPMGKRRRRDELPAPPMGDGCASHASHAEAAAVRRRCRAGARGRPGAPGRGLRGASERGRAGPGPAMAAEGKVTGQSQEQFLLLAKAARGAALASLIHQVLEAPGIYVFGELLDMPAVRELADSEFSPVFRLLTIFAYGTYADYLAEAANLPPLTEAQKNKLRHLSVVTLAAKIKCIPYSVLLEQLQLKNVRQLEDLVIEAVYADVLRGSLDQRNQRLEVDYSIGRDIRREELSTITRTLQEWCQGCEVVLSGIEEQVSRANQHKEQQLALKQQIESEVANLKKTIKVTTAAAAAATSQDPEQHLTELREPAPGTNQRQASKKTSKAKGLRGSAKIWSKSN